MKVSTGFHRCFHMVSKQIVQGFRRGFIKPETPETPEKPRYQAAASGYERI